MALRPLHRSLSVLGLLAAGLASTAALSPAAHAADAKLKLEQQGYIETDVRFVLPGKALEREDGTLRFNENRVGYQVDAEVNPKVAARAAGRLVFVGFSSIPDAADLTKRASIDPFWWELDAAYLELRDLFGLEGLDLRAGRQIIHWGTADQFNPTNNINPLDLRDPLLFGQNLANNAVKLDYAPGKDVVLTAVWVPVFRPTQLPFSALRAFSDPTLAASRFGADSIFSSFGSTAGLKYNINNQTPDFNLANSQFAAKLAFKLLGSDFSLSYYRGLWTVPRPEVVTPYLTGTAQHVDIQLGFPTMQVLGFDFTTSISALKGLGLWVEGALVFHDELRTRLDLGPGVPSINSIEAPAGQFLKVTAGMDFTFNKQLYANVQYLHGFVDEFGSRQIADYVVAGVDIKSPSERYVLRLFGVLNLQDQSHVYFPSLIMKPWNNTEFTVGALLYGGQPGSKFGGLESGSNLFFMKGRISF